MNNSRFSVLKTLRESCQLWVRYWKLLTIISMIVVVPAIITRYINLWLTPDPSNEHLHSHVHEAAIQSLLAAIVTLILSILLFIVASMKTAAILGVLKDPQSDIWAAIKGSIQEYTWTLIKVQILLSLLAWIVVIPVSIIIALGGQTVTSSNNYFLQIIFVFFAIIYLVFIKFALVQPLVVVEGRRARESLKISWQMTRGRFGYVFGCYVILGAVEYFLERWFGGFDLVSLGWIILSSIVNALFGCLWILLGWTMYHQIKSVEAEGVTAS